MGSYPELTWVSGVVRHRNIDKCHDPRIITLSKTRQCQHALSEAYGPMQLIGSDDKEWISG